MPAVPVPLAQRLLPLTVALAGSAAFAVGGRARPDDGAAALWLTDRRGDSAAVVATGDSIRAAFGRADVTAAMAYHHPRVVKAFNVADSVLDGREVVAANLRATLARVQLAFVENRVERLLVEGDMAVELTRFAIRGTPRRAGDGAPFVFRGRTMVVYVRSPASPTGWASIRELIQPVTD